MSLTEEDLLQKSLHGDQNALAALLEKYAPTVRSRLAGKIDSRWRSVLCEDDVMQETFTDVFLGISRFVPQDEGAFLRWMFTLARNNLLDAVKGLRTFKQGGAMRPVDGQGREGSELDLMQQLGGTVTSPSLAAARNEAKQLLEQAIAKLSPPDQTVVRRYDLEGWPVDRVAEELGCSPGAVFMRRARAHQRLREALGSSSNF